LVFIFNFSERVAQLWFRLEDVKEGKELVILPLLFVVGHQVGVKNCLSLCRLAPAATFVCGAQSGSCAKSIGRSAATTQTETKTMQTKAQNGRSSTTMEPREAEETCEVMRSSPTGFPQLAARKESRQSIGLQTNGDEDAPKWTSGQQVAEERENDGAWKVARLFVQVWRQTVASALHGSQA